MFKIDEILDKEEFIGCICGKCMNFNKTKSKERGVKIMVREIKNGKKIITVKKSLSGKSVFASNPCGDHFEDYVKKYGFQKEPTDAQVLSIVGNTTYCDYLKRNGYFSIDDDEIRFMKGGKFHIKVPPGVKVLTLVAITDPKRGKEYVIWSLVNNLTGNPWDGSFCTVDKPYLTKNELEAISGVKQPVENMIKAYRG